MNTIDWTKSMQQTYEFVKVDPNTWFDGERIKTVTSCQVVRDSSDNTLGYATIDADELDTECYIRVYLKAVQNGFTYREPLGTFLIQTPNLEFDGKKKTNSIDAYTPLTELNENYPDIGYSILSGQNIIEMATKLTAEHARAPIVSGSSDSVVSDGSVFVAETDETWLTYLINLMTNANYHYGLDPYGKILFLPDQDAKSLQPVWTYNDDNSSILSPPVTLERDLYSVPNVVEIVLSTTTDYYVAIAKNEDVNSPTSIQNRGREITYREINPDGVTLMNHSQLDLYAEKILKEKSSLEYTLTYTHGYCPVKLDDCVRFNYKRAGLTNIKAKVTSQSIECKPGCQVTETAVFTTNVWG